MLIYPTLQQEKMFTAWFKKWFWYIELILPFMTTVRGVSYFFYNL